MGHPSRTRFRSASLAVWTIPWMPAPMPARQNMLPQPENINSRAARSEISATFAPPEQA